MSRRNLLNLLLAIGLVILALVIFFNPGQQPEPQSWPLTVLDPKRITRVEIDNRRYPAYSFHKLDNAWRIETPFPAPANKNRINNLLEIAGAKSRDKYALTDLDLEQLHLLEPELRIRLDDTELLFGTTEPLSQRRYVLSGDQVHLVTDRYTFMVQGPATDFVDPALLPENVSIRALQLPDYHLQMQDGVWRLVNQEQQPAADRVQELLDEWRYSRASSVSRLSRLPNGKLIRVELATQTEPIEFVLAQIDDEMVFHRADLGLAYHFTPANAQRLLSLPPARTPEPEPPKPED